jgi:UDP-N-acetylmuramoyl-tripeptide--D-alanyl-D-alanine ligase
MSVLDIVTLVIAAVAAVIVGIRFLRIAQREHYLRGAPARFFFRWWATAPLGPGLLVLAGCAAIASVVVPGIGLVTGAIVGVGPPGLSIRGRTGKLAWTRRLRVLAAVSAIVAAAPVVIVLVICGVRVAAPVAVIVAFATPAVIELALIFCAPIEERLAGQFVARARERLERVRPRVVAITGSYGKTSTKQYVAALLGDDFATVASPRSFNNRAGLARTVNELVVPGTEVLIAEMGTYGPGEIAAMCAWMPPEISVMTAIGPVHLERFKSLDRTLRAKAEITEHARVVVLNVDDPRLAQLAEELAERSVVLWRCSESDPSADVAVIPDPSGLGVFSRGSRLGTIDLDRERSVAPTNLACAIAVALALEVAPAAILDRAGQIGAVESRLVASRSAAGVVVLDDTFNSNPAGATRALDQLLALSPSASRRALVTPGMIELGPLQYEENRAFAERASRLCTDVVIVGRTNRRALLEGVNAGAATVHLVADRAAAVAFVRTALTDGDAVLYENDLPDHYP